MTTTDTTGGSLRKILGAVLFLGIIAAGLTLIVIFVRIGQSSVPVAVRPVAGSVVQTNHPAVLYVQEAGQIAWDRAYADRDERAEDAVLALYETFNIDAQVPVRITTIDRDMVQVELLAGPNAGRRAWGHAALVGL